MFSKDFKRLVPFQQGAFNLQTCQKKLKKKKQDKTTVGKSTFDSPLVAVYATFRCIK